jgi:hypothetical protein
MQQFKCGPEHPEQVMQLPMRLTGMTAATWRCGFQISSLQRLGSLRFLLSLPTAYRVRLAIAMSISCEFQDYKVIFE